LKRKNSSLIDHLVEEVRFLSGLGAEFVFAANGVRKDRTVELRDLEEKILHCRLCPLAAGRKNAVPGEGSFQASLMFVGEAPGADEDAQGRPFVGRAGQLLTRIIKAMKFKRGEVFITNVVKCRPPQNRTPLREEVETCRDYLLRQIDAISPGVIVSLGKVATDFFVSSGAGMSALRGSFHRYGRILVMPTFHPSYVLRNEGNKNIKKLVWQDMQKVMAVLGKK
jgi:uracil-DNA glycosylase family 4